MVPLPAAGHDLGLLIARLIVGSVMIAHGLQMLLTWKVSGTAAQFEKIGVPLPTVSTLFSIAAQLGGGILILLGLAIQLAGTAMVLNMLGAWFFVHRGHGVFVKEGGWELVGLLGTAAFLFILTGPGRFSLDALLTRRRRTDAAPAHRQHLAEV